MNDRTIVVERARSMRPQLGFVADDFLAWLDETAVAVDETTVANAGDLLLAFLCTIADAAALATFDVDVIARLRAANRSETDELRQAVRAALLLPRASAPPRIALYRGKSSLRSWVRVVARRLGNRRTSEFAAAIEATELTAEQLDPELELAGRQAARSFRAALERAVQPLEPDERLLVVAHFIDGKTLEELARGHRASRATVTRRLRAACDKIRARMESEGEAWIEQAPAAESLARILVGRSRTPPA